jgi:hypothetical protein
VLRLVLNWQSARSSDWHARGGFASRWNFSHTFPLVLAIPSVPRPLDELGNALRIAKPALGTQGVRAFVTRRPPYQRLPPPTKQPNTHQSFLVRVRFGFGLGSFVPSQSDRVSPARTPTQKDTGKVSADRG